MEDIEITANGTIVFTLQPGWWRLDLEYTSLDAGAQFALKVGSDSSGSNHAAALDAFGNAIVFSSTPRVPPVMHGAGPWSIVTTGIGTSTGVKAVFRKTLPSSM